jgi:hypothetical protein
LIEDDFNRLVIRFDEEMSVCRTIITITQPASFYTLYKPDDD